MLGFKRLFCKSLPKVNLPMNQLVEKIKNLKLVRSLIYTTVGAFTYPGLTMFNKMKIEGMEHLENLPRKNVLFVSNHQTYFADVIAFLHIFCAVKWRKKKKIRLALLSVESFYKRTFCCRRRNDEQRFYCKAF